MSSIYEEIFSHLTWDDILEKADVRDRSCSVNLDDKIETIVQINLRIKKLIFASCGFDNDDTQRIINILDELVINAPLVKRRKIEECPAPSSMGNPSQWKPGSSADKIGVIKCIQNHRSHSSRISPMKVHGVPVTLLVKEFGGFVDLLQSESYTKFIPLAVKLMQNMNMIFTDEEERVKSLRAILNEEFDIQKITKHKSFSTDLCISCMCSQYIKRSGNASPHKLCMCGYSRMAVLIRCRVICCSTYF